MPLVATTLSFSAAVMAFVATFNRNLGDAAEPPSWTASAAVALGGYCLFIVPYLFFLRSRIFGKGREQAIAKGIDPVGFIGLAGMTMFISPTCIAMFLTFAGFPLLHMYVTTAYSLFGMAVWPFIYRR